METELTCGILSVTTRIPLSSVVFWYMSQCFFPAQPYFPRLIDTQHLHHYLVPFLEDIGHFLDAPIFQLGNVDQTFRTGQNFHKSAKVHDPLDFAQVNLSRLRLAGQVLDNLDRLL